MMKYFLIAICLFMNAFAKAQAQIRIPTKLSTDTLANKVISGSSNTLTNIDKVASIINYNRFPGALLFQDSFHIWTGLIGHATNLGIGHAALASTVTVVYSTAVGDSALAKLTTGDQNTAIGTWAGTQMTSGSDNTAVGTFALSSDSSGSGNTAIGRNAIAGIVSGNSNVALGYYAGRWITGGSTSNSIANTSIYIGSNTRASASNQTNQIVIGDALTGLGSNTTIIGNASTTQTHLNGSLTVGSTTSPVSSTANFPSSNKGLYFAPKTLTQRNAVSTPLIGLTQYNTTDSTLDMYNGSAHNQFGNLIIVPSTITAAATTGDRTIHKISGTVNIAAAGTSVVVTDNKVTANSIINAMVRTNDANKTHVYAVVPGAGSFTIYVDPPPAGEISIGFLSINQ